LRLHESPTRPARGEGNKEPRERERETGQAGFSKQRVPRRRLAGIAGQAPALQ
jgi:hypothetical protein